MPFHEHDLPEMVARNVGHGRLRFTTDIAHSVHHGELSLIATGMPADQGGSADLQYILAAARSIGAHMRANKVVVQKSTVPVGTALKVRAAIEEQLRRRRGAGDSAVAVVSAAPVSLVSNPEFLKEGAAVDDFMRPDRIVIGTEAGVAGQRARELMSHVYAPFNRQRDRILFMDIQSAELTKYAANAMLATRISFMNELANLAGDLGVDIEQVRKGHRRRSPDWLRLPLRGSRLWRQLLPEGRVGADAHRRRPWLALQILEAVKAVNDAQKHVLVEKVASRTPRCGRW